MKFKQCIMSINRHDLVSRLFAVALMLMTAFAVNAQTPQPLHYRTVSAVNVQTYLNCYKVYREKSWIGGELC